MNYSISYKTLEELQDLNRETWNFAPGIRESLDPDSVYLVWYSGDYDEFVDRFVYNVLYIELVPPEITEDQRREYLEERERIVVI